MPAKKAAQSPVKDDDISGRSSVLTLDSEMAEGVEDWLVAPNSTMETGATINDAVEVGATDATIATEDQDGSITTVADNKAAINADSVEGEAATVEDLLEDNHEDEFLATTSSHPSDGSYNAAESEEEVGDEILESVSAILLKINNNFNSLTPFSFLGLANCYSARDGRMARGLQRVYQLGRRAHHLLPRRRRLRQQQVLVAGGPRVLGFGKLALLHKIKKIFLFLISPFIL